jgi:hypothetical protein
MINQNKSNNVSGIGITQTHLLNKDGQPDNRVGNIC